MEDIVYYNALFDLYENLLTEKQKIYFKDYYFNNLSFSEMAENYGVSRNAIFKQLHITVEKLKEYEEKLNLYDKNIKIKQIAEKIEDKNLKKELLQII